MRSSSLTGITSGEFDSLRVRNPPFTGPFVDVTGGGGGGGSYDDTALTQAVATNAAAIQLKADASDLLTPVPAGAQFTDTIYTHPSSHPFSMVTGLQSALDGKEDTIVSLSQSKVTNLVSSSALSITNSEFTRPTF